jgi:hypothetical protein
VRDTRVEGINGPEVYLLFSRLRAAPDGRVFLLWIFTALVELGL